MRLEIEISILSLYININDRFEIYLTKCEGIVSLGNLDFKLWSRW